MFKGERAETREYFLIHEKCHIRDKFFSVTSERKRKITIPIVTMMTNMMMINNEKNMDWTWDFCAEMQKEKPHFGVTTL